MLRIILFNQSDNLYAQCLSHFEQGLIVAPSPQMADIIRRKMTASSGKMEVVTISKFLRDELSLLVGEEVSENYRGKSELLLLLSSLWKKLEITEGSYELFQRCFRLLTDLRSFSMNDEVLETALEHFDKKAAFGVMRMHQILNQLDIYDEHRSYFQLSERLRSGDLPITYTTERNLVFLGFDFLSGSQVDLLRSYAIRDNVALPVYQKVYQNLSDWDWLSWLDGEEVNKTVVDAERPKKEAALKTFPKNYLSKALKTALAQKETGPCQIILGERRASIETIQQVNLTAAQYKTVVEVLGDKIEWLCAQIELKEPMRVEELLSFLEGLFEQAVQKQDFRELRSIQLFLSLVADWRELSADNEIVTDFDFKIFKEALFLNAPRVFQTSLSQNAVEVEIKTLKEIDDVHSGGLKILCVTSDFSSPKSSLAQYTEGLEKYLSSVGPLRRAELEFVALKEKLLDALDSGSVALVEEGVLAGNLSWKNIFESMGTKASSLEMDFEKKAFYNHASLPDEIQTGLSISATRLQTYVDCPRKYLFKHVLKLSPNYVFQDQLDSLELGRLQHKTIEEYVGRFNHYSEEEHWVLVKKLLAGASLNKKLDKASVLDHKLETVAITSRTIIELLKIKAVPGNSVSFEQSIDEPGFRGSVDCVIENKDEILLLDFKRGAGSLPSQKGFKNFEKVQLWFYGNHWKFSGKEAALGYVSLNELEASTLYFSSDRLKEKYGGLFEAKAVSLEKEYEKLALAYQQYEQEWINKLKGDKVFLANPQKSQICDYCDLNKICERRSRGEEHVGA